METLKVLVTGSVGFIGSHLADELLSIGSNQLHLKIVILRYHTTYGPRQRPDMAIYRWTKQIFEGKPIVIYGDEAQTGDFTYISDVVDVTIKAAEIDGIEDQIFNIGSGKRISVNDTVKLLVEASGVNEARVKYEPLKLGDVKDTHADISKAERLLGFRPKVELEDGLRCFIEWYRRRFSS